MTTWGLVAIVKDEMAVIDAFLASARRYCDSAVIVDTGSTDGTPERIAELWPEAVVHHRPWKNFGHNRSEAFALAQGSADWLLALDADMTVEIDDGFVPPPFAEALHIEMGNGGPFRWRLPLVLRGDLPWASFGAVHEYTALADKRLPVAFSTDAVRVRYPDRSSPEKTAWQLAMLEEEAAESPGQPRNTFYRAQCLNALKRKEEARELYLERADMGGWDQEAWYASFQAALLAPDWRMMVAELMECHEDRPHRLEAVVALARELNARDLHRAAWQLTDVPLVPTPDSLFVHLSAWDWGLTFERHIAAWWVGKRDLSDDLGHRLLRNPRLPDNIRAAVERNLALKATA